MPKILNPVWYLNGFTSFLYIAFGPILRLMGLMKSEPRIPHDDTTADDVAAAAQEAVAQAEALEELGKLMTPAEVVRAYAHSVAEDRPSMDLSVLTEQQQDWLLSRGDVDLIFLANETDAGLDRSLNALKVFWRQPRREEPEPTPVLSTTRMSEEEKALFIRARYRELWLPDGSPNPHPKYGG